jgi:hypothetical protein
MENQDRIKLLKDKILQHIQNNTMDISSELQIFEALSKTVVLCVRFCLQALSIKQIIICKTDV